MKRAFLLLDPLTEEIGDLDLTGISWVIVAGECGREARPFNIQWALSVVAQCRDRGVPVFVRQLGSLPYTTHGFCGDKPITALNGECIQPLVLTDSNGGDMAEWPECLRVRQMPAAA